MRKLVLDEISAQDMERIRDYLNSNAVPSEIEDLYWVELTGDLLDERQSVHHACQPYRFAVELTPDAVHLEMLIRSRTTLLCDCIRYASPVQVQFILRFADRLVEACKVRT